DHAVIRRYSRWITMLVFRLIAVLINGHSRVLFLVVRARECGGRGPERRAVVWPVSCPVRGRAWPGGLTLAGRGRAAPARPLRGPARPPGLARRGTRAGEVGKEPYVAAPGTRS